METKSTFQDDEIQEELEDEIQEELEDPYKETRFGIGYFKLVAVKGSVDFDGLKNCFKLLEIKMTNHDIARMMDRYDFDGDGKLSSSEFFNCMHLSHPSEFLQKRFNQHDSWGKGVLSREQARRAILSVGTSLSTEESLTLMNRFDLTDVSIDFNTFCKFMISGLLYLHEDRPIVVAPSRPKPANWQETVYGIHKVFGLLVAFALLFPRFKSALPTNNTKILANSEMDIALMVCLCAWGGFYIISLRSRGFRTGMVMDFLSLLGGFAALILVMVYVLMAYCLTY